MGPSPSLAKLIHGALGSSGRETALGSFPLTPLTPSLPTGHTVMTGRRPTA
ncbi:hypothetical protein AHiyo1_01810 [Arthrobacter sp. Hiyo1]|nr:hypothetical protein AHiyo1_01810 [Arthrobacter sp. Hiyo1]